ncbi:uncharacterized protein LOC134282341 [Saccostrea cucullata]|uniref:uncharacterized protein LOC134282341 n=1 Tax=Saccostrea cuccullata TaxID=36930 RepID=UPI002ED435B7
MCNFVNIIFLFLSFLQPVHCKLCDGRYFDIVGRVVFGEARGEPMAAKLGVVYTMLNRMRHEAYPNNLYSVIYERMTTGDYMFQTLNDANHTLEWQQAKINRYPEYEDVFQATVDALCRYKSDPTTCATNFCSTDPCPATESNPWWLATNKIQLGNLYFVCRVSATASRNSRDRGRG